MIGPLHRQAFSRTQLFFVGAGLLLAGPVAAQVNVTAANTTYTITFDASMTGVNNGTFTGAGVQAVPGAGRLDSDAWASTGMSDGDLAFGGSNIAGDHARGTTAPGNAAITTGGFYSFGGGSISGRALGIQPIGTDWTPGTLTLRVVNNSGLSLTAFDLAYNLHIRNDQDRANSFDCAWSADNITYTTVPSLAHTSIQLQDALGFQSNAKSATLTGFVIAPGGFFYIRWSGDDVSGSGNRDEFAIDDIAITGRAYTALRFVSTSSSALEDGVSHSISVGIVNASISNPTTVDVVLISGDAARIGNYTTQTLTWPANNTSNQTLSVLLSDNGACDGDAVEVFQLQNATGGTSANVGGPSLHTLTVDDDETALVTFGQQAFDGGVNDNWTILGGAGNVSSNTGATDSPANQRVLSAPSSWQVNNATATLDLGTISCAGFTGVTVRIRLSSTSGVPGNGADASDNVRVWADVNGAGFPVSPDIQVSGNTNARWGYSSGTGVVSTAAGTPVAVAPAGGGNRTADGYTFLSISIPDGSSTVALRITAANNDVNEIWNVDNVIVEGVQCQPVYYSRASGATTAAIWSTARTGSPAPSVATFDCNATMVIQALNTVDMGAGPFNLRELYVETGGTLNNTASPDIDICGNTVDFDGALTGANFGTLEFLNTSAATLDGNVVAVNIETLVANGSGLTILNLDTVNIWTEVRVDNGNLNASATRLTLRSDASGTARLGPVIAPDTYTGSLTMERFIPAGVTNWRSMACPIVGKNVASWKDDFYTAGFPGSHFPGFQVGGNPWPSIRHYVETNPGATLNDGLVGVTGTGMLLSLGKGFTAWAGTTLNTTTAFVIDVTGVPNIAGAPFTLPMTYTNTGNPTVDGWNLVGNPLPSPIDFTDVVLGANVDNFYYVFNPASGNNVTWNESLGLSIPAGLNGNIQSSQGFWLKANGAAVTTTVDESAKVLDVNGGGLFGIAESAQPMVRVQINSSINPFLDETVLHFGTGTPAYGDANDIEKFVYGHPEAPIVWSESAGGEDLILNAWGELTTDADIAVAVKVGVTGTYALKIHDGEGIMGVSCLVLEDLYTGTTTVVTDGAEYLFTANVNDPAEPARFVIHASAALPRSYEDATCATAADGKATVLNNSGDPVDITWMDDMGNVLLQQTQVVGVASLTGLAAGDYLVQVSNTGCSALTEAFTIQAPPALGAGSSTQSATCSNATDGGVDLTVMGGAEPYSFAWSNGANTEDLTNVAAGAYDVQITDANGCTQSVMGIAVAAEAGPLAAFIPSSTLAYTGETVYFFNTGTYGVQYTWDFGDGTTSNAGDGEHVYTLPGNYTVVLTVEDGDCSSVATYDVVITSSTGLVQLADDAVNVYSDGQDIVAQWNVAQGVQLTLAVMDLNGRMVMHEVLNGASGLHHVEAGDLAPGTYFVQVTTGEEQRTFKVPVLR